jgi:hypothetical protein
MDAQVEFDSKKVRRWDEGERGGGRGRGMCVVVIGEVRWEGSGPKGDFQEARLS